MTLSVNQQLEVEKPVTRVVYFIELAFSGGTTYWNTMTQNVDWGGHTWYGIGAIADISEVSEANSMESFPLSFSVNIADQSILAIAVGSVEVYRGRSAKMYMCPMAENFTLVNMPVLCWVGTMDTVAVGVDGADGKIVLKCENSAFSLKRVPNLRINAAQHKALPGNSNDLGFDYLIDLMANPQTWLSKKFQSR